MRGILLTWNPERWPIDPQERTELETQYKSNFLGRWSTGGTLNVPIGSPAFLLAQGKRPGIVASGFTRSDVFQDANWEGRRTQTNYVEVDFDEWIPLDVRLPKSELLVGAPTVKWNPRASGTSFDEQGVKDVEVLWTEHLDALGIGYVRQPEEPSMSEGFPEGAFKQVPVNRYERNRHARQRAIEIHGLDCKGCGFNFQAAYGSLGKDYIEVHHIVPISEIKAGYSVNPETDLVPLCANCHAMVHRENPPIKPEALRKRLKQ